MNDSQITIQAVSNGYVVILPSFYQMPNLPANQYKDAMIAVAKVMKGSDDIMDKIREENESFTPNPAVIPKIEKDNNVFIFVTLDEALAFISYTLKS